MSNKFFLFAAAALMAMSPLGFINTAMAAPRATNAHNACVSAGFQPGEIDFTDCVRSIRPLASSPNEASRFMAYAGPRQSENFVTSPVNIFSSREGSPTAACEAAGLGGSALHQCVGNLDAATFQDGLASHG